MGLEEVPESVAFILNAGNVAFGVQAGLAGGLVVPGKLSVFPDQIRPQSEGQCRVEEHCVGGSCGSAY